MAGDEALPRRTRRASITDPVIRITFLEDDMDSLEGLVNDIKAQNNKILWAVMGLVFTTGTAAIMLALQIGLGHG